MKLSHAFFMFCAMVAIQCGSANVYQPKKDWAYLEDWDGNLDESLDLKEFIAGYTKSKFYERWETKSNPMSDSAFLSGMFAFLDRNHDNKLDSTEYSSRRILWSFQGPKTLVQWDGNRDTILERDEFIKGAKGTNLIGGFDLSADGRITESEMAQGMFQVCDKDADHKVGKMEFYLWETYRR